VIFPTFLVGLNVGYCTPVRYIMNSTGGRGTPPPPHTTSYTSEPEDSRLNVRASLVNYNPLQSVSRRLDLASAGSTFSARSRYTADFVDPDR
jgi:hypothetical protein